MWLNAGDRNLVKLVLYMRGSEAFLQAIYTYYKRYMAAGKGKKEGTETTEIKSLRQSNFPFIFTVVLATFVFYGYIFEPKNLPKSAVARMDDISVQTIHENAEIAYFRELTN